MTEPILNSVDELLDEIRRLREENAKAEKVIVDQLRTYAKLHDVLGDAKKLLILWGQALYGDAGTPEKETKDFLHELDAGEK